MVVSKPHACPDNDWLRRLVAALNTVERSYATPSTMPAITTQARLRLRLQLRGRVRHGRRSWHAAA